MFGKDDLVTISAAIWIARAEDATHLHPKSRHLRLKIAEIEARFSEEKTRRERDRVLGEIEAIKTRLKRAVGAFAPVVGELCEATKIAAAVVPEARELNSFLLSVATEVDSVVDPLLHEMDQRADAVRVGHPPRDNRDRLLRFPRNKEKEITESAA